MADRLCITLVNNRVLQDKHFDRQESGAVFLNDAGRKQFLTAWQNRKREEITHPFLKEKSCGGLFPMYRRCCLRAPSAATQTVIPHSSGNNPKARRSRCWF